MHSSSIGCVYNMCLCLTLIIMCFVGLAMTKYILDADLANTLALLICTMWGEREQ